MITLKDLRSAMPTAKRLFGRLQDHYAQLPETRCACEQPGICCMFLPEITALEGLQWIYRVNTMPDPELTRLVRRFVEFFLTNPARLAGCPFINDGLCTIYRYRAFGCRAYGLWSQKMGRSRTAENRHRKKALRQMWRRFGVELPARVVEFEIDYCREVEIEPSKHVADKKIMDLLRQVYALGEPLGDLQARFEKEYHSDFSLLVTSLAVGMKKAFLLKFAVIKEIVETGAGTHLQGALSEISPFALRC